MSSLLNPSTPFSMPELLGNAGTSEDSAYRQPVPNPALHRHFSLTGASLRDVLRNRDLLQAPLTSLTLDTVEVDKGLLQLTDVLYSLQSSLEHLSVCNLTFSDNNTHTTVIPVLRKPYLSQLRRLRVVDTDFVALAIIESLTLPPCLELVLIILPIIHDSDDTNWSRDVLFRIKVVDRRVGAFLSAQYGGASAAGERFTSSHIIDPCWSEIDKTGRLQYFDPEFQKTVKYEHMVCCELQAPAFEGTLPARVTVALQYDDFDPDEAALHLLKLFPPLNAVRYLYVGVDTNASSWIELAKLMPAVKNLHTCDDADMGEDDLNAAGGVGWLFPAIRSVEYHTIWDKPFTDTLRGLEMSGDM